MASPTELKNSRRMLEKVTYTPVKIAQSDGAGGALEIAIAVRGLNLQPGEAINAARQSEGGATDALKVMEELSWGGTPAARLDAASRLAAMPIASLSGAVARIRAVRQDTLNGCVALIGQIAQAYAAAQKQQTQRPEPGDAVEARRLLQDRLSTALKTLASGLINTSPVIRAGTLAVAPPLQAPLPVSTALLLGPSLAATASAATAWADQQQADLAHKLMDRVAVVIPANLRVSATSVLYDGVAFLIDQTTKTAAIESHLNQRALQPMGLLHLEQLVTTPLEVQRGELIYSLPLAPFEKVTVSHKEWTLREEEYSRFVQDYLENYSERGVAQSTDISISSSSETEHDKTLSMSKPAGSGGATLAQPVDMTAPGVTDVTKEKQSQEKSRKDTQSVTEKASSLAIRDQKISFTVATTTGTEDFTARLYENRTTDRMMLIDYFRRMRRWRNDLYRVGIRLTYDVVLPDPGRRLRERWLQLKSLDAQINAPFEFTLGVRSPFEAYSVMALGIGGSAVSQVLSPFSRDFDSMSPEDLEMLARQYGTTLPPAPETLTALEQVTPIRASAVVSEFTAEVSVPDDYRPTRILVGGRIAEGPPELKVTGGYWNHPVTITANDTFVSIPIAVRPEDYAARTIAATFIAYAGAVGEGRIKVELTPSPAKMRAWRASAWDTLRQAALARFNEKRENLRQQRTALLAELQAPDTLALRRMEREQIMYLVLEWLFPDFAKSKDIDTSLTAWETVLEYGEYIKFVHEAIDWDRILVLLYPYFWGRADTHDSKLYLDHPDGVHREFLRAGAARVILAIKPGYERDVVSLLDQGKLGTLSPASRFEDLIVAVQKTEKDFEDLQAAALAPFRDGDGPDDRPDVAGILIGQWFEYTPTSALDADVTVKPLLS